MNRSQFGWLALCILALIVMILLFYPKIPVEDSGLDLGEIHVDSVPARNFLRSDAIKIRRLDSDYRPSGVLPILDLDQVSASDCRDLLDRIAKAYSLEGTVHYTKDILSLQGQDVALWVSVASGAFKMTRFRESMSTPASIGSGEAIQIALDHIARNKLVQLSDSEELDVLFVSAVKNAVTRRGEESSVDQFVSDHYVAFGRRYKGIPVVGSELVLRLNGKGAVVMIKRLWRRVEQSSADEAQVSDAALERLIVGSTEFKERFAEGVKFPMNICILSKRCGYLEAPTDFQQRHFRPGCEVTFHMGDGRDEGFSQILVPLEGDMPMERLFGEQLGGQSTTGSPPRPQLQ